MIFKSKLMDEAAMKRALVRISHEIIEHNNGVENLALIGIKRRGVPIAQILSDSIHNIENTNIEVGTLDITLYRDDLDLISESAKINASDIPFSVVGKNIILVDDVIYTGRTVRAAIDAIFSLGRPQTIQLAVLIDRGHRQLPIRPDYVGKNIPTSKNEIVKVMMNEIDGSTGVDLWAREN